MGKRFAKRRWRRPERMLLDDETPVVRRKDLGVAEIITVESDLARKTSRRAIEIILGAFVLLAAIEGAIVGAVVRTPIVGLIFFGLYAGIYFAIARELGDTWLVRALRAKPAESARLERLVASEAASAGVSAPRLLISAASTPNAFSFALRRRWLVVTSPSVDEDELVLEGMFAHEIIHLRDHDSSVAGLFIILAASPELVLRRAGVLVLLSIPLWPAAVALRLLRRYAVAEDRELRADVAGAMLTRYPPGMVSAIRNAGGGSCGLRTADPFWFVARGSEGSDAEKRATLVAEM
jgi:Zn-dependent protease with chaperone function